MRALQGELTEEERPHHHPDMGHASPRQSPRLSTSVHLALLPSSMDHTSSHREPKPSLLKLLLLAFPQRVHAMWALWRLVLWEFPAEGREF